MPRPDIIAIEDDKSLRDVQALVLTHGYSRIPVYDADETSTTSSGIVYAKDVLKSLHQGKHDAPLAEVVREAHYVPESKKVADLLARDAATRSSTWRSSPTSTARSTGLVTLEDLLEELVGEITDEYDREEPEFEQVDENVYRVSGKTSIDDINELLDVELPDEEWDTVGGLRARLLRAASRMPARSASWTGSPSAPRPSWVAASRASSSPGPLSPSRSLTEVPSP